MRDNPLVTVTLNPSIDKTVTVDELITGGLNRIISVRYDFSGKGINLSKAYHALGGETKASGLMHSDDAEAFIRELEQKGITHDFVELDGRTRENLKAFDAKTSMITEINESGNTVGSVEIERITEKTGDLTKTAWAASFSGSIPPGCPEDIYEKLVRIAKENGAVTLLDCDGAMLKSGLCAEPDIIKPNLFELSQILGTALETKKDMIDAARGLIETYSIRFVAVTLGADGAMLVTESMAYVALPLVLNVQSATGAGDTFAAGLLWALKQGLDAPDMLRWGMAAASDAVTRPGTQVCTLAGTEQWIDKVVIEQY
ncbi:MAG: 1-phosphofructokinase family hexose kinase [Eubacteriales bacterium]